MAHAVAVWHLVEAVLRRDRTDLHGFEQDIIARVALVRHRQVASDPVHSKASDKRSGCSVFVPLALRADKQQAPFLCPTSFKRGWTEPAVISVYTCLNDHSVYLLCQVRMPVGSPSAVQD